MLLIAFETSTKDRDLTALGQAVAVLGSSTRPLRTTWLVDSHLNAPQAWALLEPHVDKSAGDRLLVIEVNAENRQGWLPKPTWDFLSARGPVA